MIAVEALSCSEKIRMQLGAMSFFLCKVAMSLIKSTTYAKSDTVHRQGWLVSLAWNFMHPVVVNFSKLISYSLYIQYIVHLVRD